MGCGASDPKYQDHGKLGQEANSYGDAPGFQMHSPVAQAKMGEEARVAPLLVRMENITNLHKEGLMSHNEFETYRAALVAEIAGSSSAPSMSGQKVARIKRADEVRQLVDQLENLMKSAPDALPDEYYRILEALPHKFTREVAEQDEWGNACSGPMQEYYNNIAGRTIEEILADKSTKLDAHQNPMGTEFDLPRDGTMQENTVVLLWFSEHGTYGKPVDALRAKGFKVVVHNSQRSTIQQMMVSLLKADVVWVVSGPSITEPGFDQLVNALELFHRRGGGIFVWADNEPYFAHANYLLTRLLPGEDIFLEGNDRGSQVMRVHSDGLTPGTLTRSHLIMTGLQSLYEGVTICHLSRIGPLKILATYNNGAGYAGKPYCAVADADVYRKCRSQYKMGRGRIVIDGGFTKLYDECWNKTAGTERYVKNASAWLLNMHSRILSEADLRPATPASPTAQARSRNAPDFSDFGKSEVDFAKMRNGNKSYRG